MKVSMVSLFTAGVLLSQLIVAWTDENHGELGAREESTRRDWMGKPSHNY